jgi:hypothetical protein
MCRFSDAGSTDLATRPAGRRPKSAKARNRVGIWCAGSAAGSRCRKRLWGFGRGALVKAVVFSEVEVHMIIHALAQQQRFSGESPGKAFAKFITHDPHGAVLYQILKSIFSDSQRLQLFGLLATPVY